MTSNIFQFRKAGLIIIGLFVLLLTACNDEPVQPVLPPLQSFEMDFSNFQNEKSAELFIGNWAYSVATVSVFNIYTSLSMAIPAAAYQLALSQTPEYLGDDEWLWKFDFPVYGAIYTAKLSALAKRKGKVHWEMRIDKQGMNGYADFLWFEGETDNEVKAEWIVYESPTSPTEIVKTHWEKYNDNANGTLRYTLTRSDDDYYNSTIEWGFETEGNFNRFYNIYRSDENSDISIKWSTDDGSGRVQSPNFFNDEEWHCWNRYRLDDTCYE